MDLLKLAAKNQQRAWEIIQSTNLIGIWQEMGAKPHLIGSLQTGLLLKHRDIDFHIYSDDFRIQDSFAAMANIAEDPRIERISYTHLLHTEERCLEWHAWYRDNDAELWQLDMIHFRSDSPYAGKFEQVAQRIQAVLTPETKQAILAIKYAIPDHEKVMGIHIYQAVLRDGIRSYSEFLQWQSKQIHDEIVDWMP